MCFRSDVNVVSGQNVKSDKSRAAYQYAMHKKPHSKVDDDKVERLPAVGEVIQDRYNPRPYFGYTKIPPKSGESATYGAFKDTPQFTPGFNSGSFPAVFNVAPSTPKSVDLYTSPYNSYNPPPVISDNPPITDSYPPSSQDSYAAPPSPDNQGIYDYSPKSPQESVTPNYASLGPPLAPEYISDAGGDSMMSNGHNGHHMDAPPSAHSGHDMYGPPSDHNGHNIYSPPDHNSHGVYAPPSDHAPIDQDNGPSHYPPKSEDEIYYPPDVPNGAHDHSPKGFMPAPDTGMEVVPSNHGPFPQYLYDSHHFDHHVYEEVPHTTTEATEDKRVSSANYSYYYLGRKLWYVPLYFSIYFIIYVAILILKAIARHKIQYKQKWITNTRESRKLSYDQSEYIDNVTRNVTHALDKAKETYAFVM